MKELNRILVIDFDHFASEIEYTLEVEAETKSEVRQARELFGLPEDE